MQILINSLITGLTLAVLALGFTIVYLPLGMFYLALGAIYTLVLFVAGAMIQSGMPWYLAACAGIVTEVGISLLCEWLNPKEFALRGGRRR